jgi:hypothetical protein
MRPKVVVALLIAVGVSAAPGVARAADLPVEIVTRGVRWISLPQEVDFEVTYRIREPERTRDLALTCVVPFLAQEAGRGALEERLEPVRGGLIGVGFGRNYSHAEYQSGKQGSVYTTMDAELSGAKGTLTLHCEEPRLVLSGIGRVLIYLHKKDRPEKPVSNQVALRVVGDDESRKLLQQRFGAAIEAPQAAPTPAAPGAAPAPSPAGEAAPAAAPAATPAEAVRTPE